MYMNVYSICVCMCVCAGNTHYATNYIAAAAAAADDATRGQAKAGSCTVWICIAYFAALAFLTCRRRRRRSQRRSRHQSFVCRCGVCALALLFIFCLNFANFYYFSTLSPALCLPACLSLRLSVCLSHSHCLCGLACCFNVLSNVTKLS